MDTIYQHELNNPSSGPRLPYRSPGRFWYTMLRSALQTYSCGHLSGWQSEGLSEEHDDAAPALDVSERAESPHVADVRGVCLCAE